jgi:hypothetical protein
MLPFTHRLAINSSFNGFTDTARVKLWSVVAVCGPSPKDFLHFGASDAIDSLIRTQKQIRQDIGQVVSGIRLSAKL